MLIGADDDAPARARLDVDVRIHAALTDESQHVETFEQRCPDLGSLADEDQDLCVFQALRKCVNLLNVIVPDLDLMALQLPEARERAQRVEVVVEDRDPHGVHASKSMNHMNYSRLLGSSDNRRGMFAAV